MGIIVDHFDKITAVILLIILSIGIRFLLQILGQRWITTTAHTATIMLLPILTYVITKVISGNIALSLGMVGALSIVRFRNPVRSPLELSVYFGMITMGIAASVSNLWLIFLVVAIFSGIMALIFVNIISKYFFHKTFFSMSFTEGNNFSTLEVTSSKKISILDKNSLLTIKRKAEDCIYYTLVSTRPDELKEILATIENNKDLITYQLKK